MAAPPPVASSSHARPVAPAAGAPPHNLVLLSSIRPQHLSTAPHRTRGCGGVYAACGAAGAGDAIFTGPVSMKRPPTHAADAILAAGAASARPSWPGAVPELSRGDGPRAVPVWRWSGFWSRGDGPGSVPALGFPAGSCPGEWGHRGVLTMTGRAGSRGMRYNSPSQSGQVLGRCVSNSWLQCSIMVKRSDPGTF